MGTTTDGDGTTSGAGSDKPVGYPDIQSMLTEAASLADAVMSSGKYQLWNAEGTIYEGIAYNYLFNLEDENTNPMGFTKDKIMSLFFRSLITIQVNALVKYNQGYRW